MREVYIAPFIRNQVAIIKLENRTKEDFEDFFECPALTEEDLEKIAEHWDDED